MKKGRNILLFLLAVSLLAVFAGCGKKNDIDEHGKGAENDNIQHTIGVAVYNQENAEMRMFMNYYKNYITQGFPVKFYFSEKLDSGQDEEEFIHEMKEKGAEGIISFYAQDLQGAVAACEEEELYYIAGSGTVSGEDFQAVKDNSWFLGTIGPNPEAEEEAGNNMAAYAQVNGAKSYLILSGGSYIDNFMHSSRTKGMLETLGTLEQLTYSKSVEEILASSENEILDTGNSDISVTVVPGFISSEEGEANLKAALEKGPYDAVLSSYGMNGLVDLINDGEKSWGQNAIVGMIDCFSEENFQAVKEDDGFGNPKFDYMEGKYASMIGPAFAAMYNAVTGHEDMIRPEGEAFRLYQSFWKTAGREEFAEMYGYTQGIYENAYSSADLMKVSVEFTPDVDWEAFKSLTEASDLESVKERILHQN